MKAKVNIEFITEIEDDFKNTPDQRQALFNDLRDELPDVELNRLLIFTNHLGNPTNHLGNPINTIN